ncbi:MAG: hypothetical protein CEN89_771 [Candidatus Berkelbacteria bacterium Licking1014_7]|uniref:Nucleotidyl transferase AbiEii/AbiGii toxin family protein n=1 Tax=Candidatus Berkelbacteria bacterium Licking1014_7 TaxID=2017147 RepID=A0A554LHF5_9BACT|nr:MAG: hypothetical protein CEN89_771 [Candidatus Berkelbacteria bacterium Licking1014_7]
MENKPFELNKFQKTILKELANSPLKDNFYWTGGTALAFFYLKHRLSYDIDLFSNKQFEYTVVKKLVDKIAKATKINKIEEKKIHDRWEFLISNDQNIRIDFVFYDHKQINPRKQWQGVWVDSLEDMAANKTLALIDRHDPKDAFDIYYILTKHNYTDKKLLNLVKKKFHSDFPVSLFWSQCLLGSQHFRNLTPLLIGKNKDKIINQINEFFEKESAESVKEQI